MNNVTKPFLASKYNVFKNSWYKFEIILNPTTPYRRGVFKIFGPSEKQMLFPVIKLPDIVLTKTQKVSTIDELDKLTDFTICFKTDECVTINVSSSNLSIRNIKLVKLSDIDLRKEIDVWKFRRLYNLEYLNYYIEKMYPNTGGNLNHHFIDRFMAEYRLHHNNAILDQYISKLKIDSNVKPDNNDDKTFNVLFLVSSSYQYEETGYTLRTHQFAKYANKNDNNYKILIVTKCGYPYEMDPEYYLEKKIQNEIDGVPYYRIGAKEDHINNMNLIDYLKKYIEEIVQFSIKHNIKIIHASSNYLNGMAAVYAGQYLGIKVIYEVREFWDEMSYLTRPEIYRSDLIKLRTNLESFVMKRADYIIAANSDLKDLILKKEIDEHKVIVMCDGVDVNLFKHDDNESEKRKNKLGATKYDYVIGTDTENCQLLIDAVKKLKVSDNINCLVLYFGQPSQSLQKKIKDINIKFEANFTTTEDVKDIDVCNIVLFENNNNMDKALSYGKLILSNPSDYLFVGYSTVDDIVNIVNMYKKGEYQQMFDQNREWAINNISLESVGDRLIKFYMTV